MHIASAWTESGTLNAPHVICSVHYSSEWLSPHAPDSGEALERPNTLRPGIGLDLCHCGLKSVLLNVEKKPIEEAWQAEELG